MKTINLFAIGLIAVFAIACTSDNETPDPDPGESNSELLVAKFTAAPILDGNIEDMWSTAQRLVGTTEVPTLAARGTYLNSDGEGIEESLGLFAPYSGEKYDYTLRSGYMGDMIYFLMEWDDSEDSKDRESWYFDSNDNKWKSEHKYANALDDKFYEDKFAFLWPVGSVDGFNNSNCYATCHGPSTPVAKAKDKHTRHYLNVDGQTVDMWHWKRVRGTFADQVDDQQMVYDDSAEGSGANGRKGDEGSAGYSGNSQTLFNGTEDVSVPKYIIPGAMDYYWITQTEIDNGTAKLITAVDGEGILTYEGGTVNPTGDAGYNQGTGNKRFPSVTTKAFTGSRGDISIKAVFTGTGWICEFSRKLNTGNSDDVTFVPGEQIPFGLAIFNNAAIAHAIKPGLNLKFEQ